MCFLNCVVIPVMSDMTAVYARHTSLKETATQGKTAQDRPRTYNNLHLTGLPVSGIGMLKNTGDG